MSEVSLRLGRIIVTYSLFPVVLSSSVELFVPVMLGPDNMDIQLGDSTN